MNNYFNTVEGENMKLIDMHCHVFPDQIAAHAINTLTQNCDYNPEVNATLGETIRIQKEWGCRQFVMLDIATSPQSVPTVNDFLIEHNDNKHIFSFGTIHPEYRFFKEELARLEENGIKGIKFHPGYQNFIMDDPKMFPIYDEIFKRNMMILFHSGFDPAYADVDWCAPKRAKTLLRTFRKGRIILAHMGNCLGSDEVMRYLIGEDVYFDVSMAYLHMGKMKMELLIKAHGPDHFLYATDCPWSSGLKTQETIASMNLLERDKEKIFYKNAARILDIDEREVE